MSRADAVAAARRPQSACGDGQRCRAARLATWHSQRDGADEAVASELDAAVAHAAARGATAAAGELADLAVALTPGDAVARRSAAAHFHHLAGDFGRATELYALLAEELPPGAERADAVYMQALIGRESLPARARLCEAALRDAVDDDARCADIHGFLAITRWLLGDVPAGLAEARAGLHRAERTDDREDARRRTWTRGTPGGVGARDHARSPRAWHGTRVTPGVAALVRRESDVHLRDAVVRTRRRGSRAGDARGLHGDGGRAWRRAHPSVDVLGAHARGVVLRAPAAGARARRRRAGDRRSDGRDAIRRHGRENSSVDRG